MRESVAMRPWVIVGVLALVVIAIAVAWGPCSRFVAETSCTSDGGRVVVHNFTGRKLCDKPPFADNIADMGSNDYWID